MGNRCGGCIAYLEVDVCALLDVEYNGRVVVVFVYFFFFNDTATTEIYTE